MIKRAVKTLSLWTSLSFCHFSFTGLTHRFFELNFNSDYAGNIASLSRGKFAEYFIFSKNYAKIMTFGL
jgi:hypothetical protein